MLGVLSPKEPASSQRPSERKVRQKNCAHGVSHVRGVEEDREEDQEGRRLPRGTEPSHPPEFQTLPVAEENWRITGLEKGNTNKHYSFLWCVGHVDISIPFRLIA